MKHVLLYSALALAAWLAYGAFVRPQAPVAPGSSTTYLLPAEQEYYRQSFDYTMNHIEAGKPYEWASYSGSGTIVPGALFVSKSKSSCREFSEAFTVGGVADKREGIACRREGREGWCRLRKDQAQTCAMEARGGAMGVPGANVGVPSINIPAGNGGSSSASGHYNTSAPGVDAPNYNGEQPKGTDIADAVTGAAGEAGTQGSKGIADWFFGTFR